MPEKPKITECSMLSCGWNVRGYCNCPCEGQQREQGKLELIIEIEELFDKHNLKCVHSDEWERLRSQIKEEVRK